MSLPIRVSAHYRRGAPLCSMTSSRLLRAEAEPPGLRATCVQRIQLQDCFIPFSIEWCWRNVVFREEASKARDRSENKKEREREAQMGGSRLWLSWGCLWIVQHPPLSSGLQMGEDHSFHPVNHPFTFAVNICWVLPATEALGIKFGPLSS